MEIITGGVTAAKGFLAAGVEAGIKYQNRKDMAMVYSKTPCRAAGVFTTNVVKAAPVLWDKEVVESEWEAQAIVVNSGIANACTGKLGYEYCFLVGHAGYYPRFGYVRASALGVTCSLKFPDENFMGIDLRGGRRPLNAELILAPVFLD